MLEAKPAGYALSSVELQADKYATGLPAGLNPPVNPLPFVYLSTGVETRCINGVDPKPKTRAISAKLPHIHHPETLAEWITAETLVPNVARLCGMNLYLHGIGPDGTDDALRDEPAIHADVVITNPPLGRKSSVTIVNEEGATDRQTLTYNRPDFWTTTSNKQLNFVPHVKSLLKVHGRAAVVVPDNVLFEGGAGETVRKNLLRECDVHTLLRLPTGIFYAQGVKANVLFFDRKPGAREPWTKTVWVYSLRTNKHFTLKTKRMTRADLDEFVECFRPADRHNRRATWSADTPDGRWRPFIYDEILARDKVSLDVFWLRDESLEDSDGLAEPHLLAQEIAEDLRSALAQIEDVLGDLEQRAGATESE